MRSSGAKDSFSEVGSLSESECSGFVSTYCAPATENCFIKDFTNIFEETRVSLLICAETDTTQTETLV